MMLRYESAQIICFPGPKNPGRTYQNPSFCALAFFWMEYVWMMSAVPNLQKAMTDGFTYGKTVPSFKQKNERGNMTIGEAGHTTKVYGILEPIDLQCYINTANTESAKKVKKHTW